jgi:hypothetical protein
MFGIFPYNVSIHKDGGRSCKSGNNVAPYCCNICKERKTISKVSPLASKSGQLPVENLLQLIPCCNIAG